MNTADRSLAVVDYALRRRFAFIDLEPRFDDPKFDTILAQNNVSQTMRENIKNRVKDLNSRISLDKRNLGHGFEIGHSFFCPKASVQDEEKWFQSIIKYEIKPLLMEYWFDNQEKATREVHRLKSLSASGGLMRVCVFAIAFLFFTEDHPAFRKVRL